MAALSVGEVVEGSWVARDGSGRKHSGQSCGGAGASRSAGGARVREEREGDCWFTTLGVHEPGAVTNDAYMAG